jgi:Flp pilus assembly pilin Flp
MKRSKRTYGIFHTLWRKLCWDLSGQDMIEYALMAGAVALAAAVVMPDVTGSLSTIFSKIGSELAATPGGG